METITQKEYSEVSNFLREATRKVNDAGREWQSALEERDRVREKLQREQRRNSSEVGSLGDGMANPTNQYQVTGLQNRLADAVNREEQAERNYQSAKQGLEGARHSAQEFLRKVQDALRDVQNNINQLQQGSRQVRGTNARHLKDLGRNERQQMDQLTRMEKELARALKEAQNAGQVSGTFETGSIDDLLGGGTSGGRQSGNGSSRKPGYDPREIYARAKYYDVNQQLNSNPFAKYQGAAPYQGNYNTTLNDLSRYL